MKKGISTLFLCVLFAVVATAQKPSAVFYKASVNPVIDGVVDDVWAEAEAEHDIATNFVDQVPTLGQPGETTWQALWSPDGIFVLLRVTDDEFYPWYIPDPDGETWQYDKPELYFDVNYELVDGLGPSVNQGHYQVAPAFAEGLNDGTPLTCDFNGLDGSIIDYAFMVEEPNYIAEYFIPFSELVDKDGIAIDLTGEIGFDVYVIDRDPGDAAERIAVWANDGTVASAWGNMDDCGTVTFDGAEQGIYIDEITLTGGTITENNGTLQIEVAILPEEATNKNLLWKVENGTGKATVDKNGVVTGIIDGDVTITASATDGSYEEATATVTISNQIVTRPEINLIRNGYFDDVKPDLTPAEWVISGQTVVSEGICIVDPTESTNIWDFRLQQLGGWGLNNEDMYEFSFVLWADESDTMNLDFEDAREAVGYQRLGVSTHELAPGGISDWTFDSPTEPTKYIFDVQFTSLVPESNQQFQFMLGHHDPVVYIDSVELVRVDDLAFLTTDYIPVEAITVSGASTVALGESIQLSAEVFPAEATLTGVKWMVEPGSGDASIDENGLLTADTAGSVIVKAMAKDDSGVMGTLNVEVTWPLGVPEQSAGTLKVYPNPAVSELNVVLTRENSTVSIYNSVGMKMDEVLVRGTEHRFDISAYAAGIYFVRTDNAVSKFVK